MSIFSHGDYRRIIKDLVSHRKTIDSGATFQSMAEFMGIQKPYLSKVLSGAADLSSDQMYLACRYLKLSPIECDYMELLLTFSRCALSERKKDLEAKIRLYQENQLRTEAYLDEKSILSLQSDFQEFYLDPVNLIIHVALSIEPYRLDTKRILKDFKFISGEILENALSMFQRLDLIEYKGKEIILKRKSLHLSKSSPIFRAHHQLVRHFCLQNFQAQQSARGGSTSLNTSVTFSVSEADLLRVKSLVLELLKAVEGIVKEAEAEEVYQFNIDLFKWTQF